MSDTFMDAYRARSLSEIHAELDQVIELVKAMPFSGDQLSAIWKLAEANGRLGVLAAGLRGEEV